MIQFFAPDIASTLTLPESDSQHCIRVLRKQMGDVIEAVDGKGHRYTCRIIDPHPKHTVVEIIGTENLPAFWGFNLTVGVAPTKNLDRMEWLTEKLTEIGVDHIVPLLCRYSERKDIKTVRLEKIAVSAMKQSLKGVCPRIDPMTPLKDFINETAGCPQKFIAHCDSSLPRLLLSQEVLPGEDAVILIGPEGDFSAEEVKLALEAGFKAVSLGEARLRTETAAFVAANTLHIINQLNSK